MQPIQSRFMAVLAFAGAALCAFPAHAQAQTYPDRPVTIIVPFAPGGGVDTMARLMAEKMRPALGQSVIVQNKPGASGMLGAQYVADAKPDGYTLLLGSAGETSINAYVYKKSMRYSPSKDLAPVTLVTRVPNVLVAGPSLQAANVGELIQYAKAHPDAVSYAGAASFIQDGRVRALAVTSPKRASFAKDIPALAEFEGLSGYNLENWFGLFVPAGTPPAVVERLNQAATEVLRDPELVQRLRDQGGEPAPMTPKEFADFIQKESVQYRKIIEDANITVDG